MPVQRVEVHGLRELNRALKRIDKELNRELEKELREAGNLVRDNARELFSAIDARSAAGFSTRLRGFGTVVVEQRRGRTTGQHPEFGSLQMSRALLPARSQEFPKVVDHLDSMLDRLGRENGF